MQDTIEEVAIVFDPSCEVDLPDFVAWWNQEAQGNDDVLAVLAENPRPVTLGAHDLIREVVELLPQVADGAEALLKAVGAVYINEKIKAYLKARADAREKRVAEKQSREKASKEFAEEFFTVTSKDEQRRRTFFATKRP